MNQQPHENHKAVKAQSSKEFTDGGQVVLGYLVDGLGDQGEDPDGGDDHDHVHDLDDDRCQAGEEIH